MTVSSVRVESSVAVTVKVVFPSPSASSVAAGTVSVAVGGCCASAELCSKSAPASRNAQK